MIFDVIYRQLSLLMSPWDYVICLDKYIKKRIKLTAHSRWGRWRCTLRPGRVGWPSLGQCCARRWIVPGICFWSTPRRRTGCACSRAPRRRRWWADGGTPARRRRTAVPASTRARDRPRLLAGMIILCYPISGLEWILEKVTNH